MKKVFFLKAKQGLAYFPGDIVDLPEEKAGELIESGHCALSESNAIESDIPETLKFRDALIGAGLHTIDSVLAAKSTLTDIKGIGEKSAIEIVEELEKLKESE